MTERTSDASVTREFCPTCRKERNMRVSTCRREVTDPEGNVKQVLARTFHCETCNRFVRAEDVAPQTC